MRYEFHELIRAAVSGLWAAVAIIHFNTANAFIQAGDMKAAIHWVFGAACLAGAFVMWRYSFMVTP